MGVDPGPTGVFCVDRLGFGVFRVARLRVVGSRKLVIIVGEAPSLLIEH